MVFYERQSSQDIIQKRLEQAPGSREQYIIECTADIRDDLTTADDAIRGDRYGEAITILEKLCTGGKEKLREKYSSKDLDLLARLFERAGLQMFKTPKQDTRSLCFKRSQTLYELANDYDRARFVFRHFAYY